MRTKRDSFKGGRSKEIEQSMATASLCERAEGAVNKVLCYERKKAKQQQQQSRPPQWLMTITARNVYFCSYFCLHFYFYV